MAGPLQFAGPRGPRHDQVRRTHDAGTSRALASPYHHEQIREFCQFLAQEWVGNRHHSYAVPSRGKSSAWSRTVDGKWSAVGLADALSKYAWNGKSFSENKAELDRLGADLQFAIQQDSNNEVCAILRAIMHWGSADNKHRQKRTFEWIERNADKVSAKVSNAVNLIKDERASLDSFDGMNLIMNSTMAKIVSLADPEQKAKMAAQRTQCANNIRQLNLGWVMYAHDNNDQIVPCAWLSQPGTTD